MGIIFAIKNDENKRTYYTVYGQKKTKSVISYAGANVEYEGTPKLNIRLGDSKFGDEFFVELLIDKKISEYAGKANYNTVEIYFSIEEAFEMFERLKKYFEVEKKEVNNQ